MEVKSGEGTVVVDAQRDQNIINSVVQALGNKTA
nr:MAG: hypothetical protein [Bacteriophage sp.]